MSKPASNTEKNSKPKSTKYQADNGHIYLDKRTTVRLAKSAGRRAFSRAMQTMGYVVIAKNNWVIKKYRDGTEERLSLVEQ